MLSGFQKWISSYQNVWDAATTLLFFVAFGLPMGGLLTESRIVYAIDLMLFVLRILEIFYVDKTLGPYVVMTGQMVNFTATQKMKFSIMDFFSKCKQIRSNFIFNAVLPLLLFFYLICCYWSLFFIYLIIV